MSIKAMSWVFDHSESDSGARLVLLAIADYANDDGACWPAISTLAQKSHLSERMVQRHLSDLIELGELEVIAGGGRKTNVYFLPRFIEWVQNREVNRGDISDARGDTHAISTPDTHATAPLTPMPPDPLLNHHIEPSENQSSSVDVSLSKNTENHIPCSKCGAVGVHTCSPVRSFPKPEKRRSKWRPRSEKAIAPPIVRQAPAPEYLGELREIWGEPLGAITPNFRQAVEGHTGQEIVSAFRQFANNPSYRNLDSPLNFFAKHFQEFLGDALMKKRDSREEDYPGVTRL